MGQKVPLGAQHNKTKAAQRRICQPFHPPAWRWKVFSGLKLPALPGIEIGWGQGGHSFQVYVKK